MECSVGSVLVCVLGPLLHFSCTLQASGSLHFHTSILVAVLVSKHVLENKEEISEFEDVERASEEISAIRPSLDEDKDAVSMAKSWLARSQPFLSHDSMARGSSPSLVVETLKILLPESKLLKLSMRELMNYEVYANRVSSTKMIENY
ncbi:hypothetical protein BC332_00386 [Capsicum chinense]|nr:hypothetical protein BC332_00386 [Capsicum chinense]